LEQPSRLLRFEEAVAMKPLDHAMFVDAPPSKKRGGGKSKLIPLLVEATKKPERWCKIATGSQSSLSGIGTRIKRGELTGMPAGFTFEAMARDGALWVRAFEDEEPAAPAPVTAPVGTGKQYPAATMKAPAKTGARK
jgi:hypothetical protein